MDTIIASATPMGRSGVALIRLSGSEARNITDKLLRKPQDWMDRIVRFGVIVDRHKNRLDQVLLTYMKAPRSFTGEDVVEISCHGNPLIVDQIIEEAIRCGARLARSGEFTRRAVENKKLSFLQAEALNELIHSVSIEGVQVAHSGLSGKVDQNELEIREELLDICAEIEAKMDYPQEDLSYEDDQAVSEALLAIAQKSQEAADAWRDNRILIQGAKVTILGPVNAGKSSLFNHLVGSKRAIVNRRPGTTRDIIERRIILDGIDVCFFDTAGIRFSTDDPIEQEGIQMGLDLAKQSDLCLLVVPVDQSLGIMNDVAQKLNRIPLLWIGSHLDKNVDPTFVTDHQISNVTLEGIQELRKSIRRELSSGGSRDSKWIALSQRQYDLFLSIASHVTQASNSLTGILGPAVAAEEITQALEKLAELRGENAREQVLDRLFSRFCIGK